MAHFQKLHEWDLSPTQAVALQKELRNRLRSVPLQISKIHTVAGADVSFNKFSKTIYAGIVVLKFPSLEILETSGVVTTTEFPYIPGLLSFREIPALLEAWEKLRSEPDVLVCDGHGIAHPRRMGIAAHAGVLLQRPTLGCGKSVLVGKFEEPGKAHGSWSPLLHKGETIGAAVRTKNNVKPIFASPGNLCDVPSAIEVLLRCDGGYRLPEPTRRAHLFVNELRRGAL
jgi:deoxyribonuclease V